MILSLNDVSFRYVLKNIMDHVDFVVNEGEKWGIVGLNGSGKSTLLKLMAEVEKPDSGEVTILRKYRISYCPQMMEFENGKTVYETVASRMKEQTEVYQIASILNKLGIKDHQELIDRLSGGQKKRVALAIALIKEADLYLLDEPTNHLDQEMILWLEKFLGRMNKAIVFVSHDRYFLNQLTNHIVEVDNGKLYCYEGNYTTYLSKREERYALMAASERKRQNFLRHELEWIRRGAQARSTKAKGRIQRYEEVRAIESYQEKETLTLASASSRLGGVIVELDHISKSYGDKHLFFDFTYHFLRDDRIGIIGPNGSGKTTLLKILMGKERADEGKVLIGETVKIGYFSQMADEMDPDQRVIDYLKEFGSVVHTADGEAITASQMLERFLFPDELQYAPISRLSGGEKRRLFLCSILMKAPNVLILDEPTNDLDTDTQMILEDYLEGFKGLVVTVSHDRFFLDRVCERLFVFENGSVSIFEQSYSDYLKTLSFEKEESVKEEKKTEPKRSGSNHLSYKEKNEYEALEKNMPLLEGEIARIEEQLGIVSDFNKIKELSDLLEDKQKELEASLERWMELSEKIGL